MESSMRRFIAGTTAAFIGAAVFTAVTVAGQTGGQGRVDGPGVFTKDFARPFVSWAFKTGG